MPSAPASLRVLIVDDDSDTREMYSAALSFLGCDVIAEADGARGLRQAREQRPDVIVTDIVMPSVDGWTLIGDLKSDPLTRDVPVVVLTAHSSPSLPVRARVEGCAAFLMKPCLPERLLAAIRRVLAGEDA